MEDVKRKIIKDECFEKISWNHSVEALRARFRHFHERVVVKASFMLLNAWLVLARFQGFDAFENTMSSLRLKLPNPSGS